MANDDNKKMVICGLQSQTTSVTNAGNYTITISATLPNLQQGATADSQCVTTVTHNATVIYTSPAGTTGAQLLNVPMASGDTITVGLSSSAAVDQGLNVVRATVAIG
jgi:hypothetical protein